MRLAYVVVVEEEHDEEADREGDEDPFRGKGPEVDEPATFDGWVEGTRDREVADVGFSYWSGDVGEADPEDCANLRESVVRQACLSVDERLTG